MDGRAGAAAAKAGPAGSFGHAEFFTAGSRGGGLSRRYHYGCNGVELRGGADAGWVLVLWRDCAFADLRGVHRQGCDWGATLAALWPSRDEGGIRSAYSAGAELSAGNEGEN